MDMAPWYVIEPVLIGLALCCLLAAWFVWPNSKQARAKLTSEELCALGLNKKGKYRAKDQK